MSGDRSLRRRIGRRIAAGVVLAAGATAPLAAQAPSDARLVVAINIAQSGRADSARALVRQLLATLAPGDSVYPQALFVQGGMLAPDAATAATSLQRVVVEYGTSPWADDALLRLAQLFEAQNDPAAAVQAVERMRRDYPDSPLLPRAAFVGARAAFDLRDEARGCGYVDAALTGSGGDVEFKNQVTFYAARCNRLVSATTGDSGSLSRPRYAVQVLAGKSAPQVDELLTRLKTMGYEAHVVRDSSGFLKVRVGRYPTRDAAQRAQAQLKTRLGGQPFVVEEP
ncbi:MAG: SPOR domain-containing protein [Gemmatimonadales bacterium]